MFSEHRGLCRRVLLEDSVMPRAGIEGEDLIWSYAAHVNPTSWAISSAAGDCYNMFELGATIVAPVELYASSVNALCLTEDRLLVRLLEAAVSPLSIVVVDAGCPPSPEHINAAMAMIEQRELCAAAILCHDSTLPLLEEFPSSVVAHTLAGMHIWTADVYSSPIVPPDSMYILAPSEYVGVTSIVRDWYLRPDGSLSAKLGMSVLNGYAIAKVRLSPPRFRFVDVAETSHLNIPSRGSMM